jgi:hypothetical protein
MGNLQFDGWKTLVWNNPDYISEVRTREIRVYPIYPRGMPFVKFNGFQITRDASHIGDDFVGYFKDVKIVFDKAVLETERDIVDEDIWGILDERETERQNAEMAKFGDRQLQYFLERQKIATETGATSSLVAPGQGGQQQPAGAAE